MTRYREIKHSTSKLRKAVVNKLTNYVEKYSWVLNKNINFVDRKMDFIMRAITAIYLMHSLNANKIIKNKLAQETN